MFLNCPMKFVCSQSWDDLAAIERHADVRYCDVCSNSVYFVRDSADLAQHVKAGHCIAFQSDDDGDDPDDCPRTMGMPSEQTGP